ncbi:MAG: preprotein translocase subunit YajC [Kiritimatiellaeota bacterium]|nr:preprotein translocase subunit YajC [Kiritimatiellota bacterium]
MGTTELTATVAAAQPAPGGAPGDLRGMLGSFMPMILIFVIMYLLLIRPQQKKAKEHRELVSQLKAGDAVVTNGGIHGTVSTVKEKTIMLKVADGVEIEVARAAVAAVLDRTSSKDRR